MAPKLISLGLIGLLVVWFAWSFTTAPQASSRPFEVYEMGDNCVYVGTGHATQSMAAVPRGTAPNYYGRCQ